MKAIARHVLKTFLKHPVILLLIIFAAFLRFLWLDKIPNAIGGDEMTYVLTVKSIALWGRDLTGTWFPWQGLFFVYPPSYMQAELPYLLLLPVIGLTDLSLFTARFTYALLSIGTVILIYKIAKELFGKSIGFIAGLLAAINPWLFFIGRTNYEMVPAMFFYLLGLYGLLVFRKWKILFSLLFFALAFYSYIGTKVLLLPFIVVSVVYVYFFKHKKRFLPQYSIVFLGCVALTLFFFFSIKSHAGEGRLSEIVTPASPVFAQQVDDVRKVTLSNPVTPFVDNKLTAYLDYVWGRLFESISPAYLFLTGDGFFGLWNHGLFYVIDLLFLIAGLVLASQKRAVGFLLFLIGIGFLPQLLHNTPGAFTPHITLIFPFILMIIAVGIWGIMELKKGRKYLFLAGAVIFSAYFISFMNFFVVYFYQFPLRGNFDFSVRPMSMYVGIVSETGRSVRVYSPEQSSLFTKYLFYTDGLNKSTLPVVQAGIKNNKYALSNVEFTSCPGVNALKEKKSVHVIDVNCGDMPELTDPLYITQLKDGGKTYVIINDEMCKKFSLKSYPSNLKISDFAIESMDKKQLCETFVTR